MKEGIAEPLAVLSGSFNKELQAKLPSLLSSLNISLTEEDMSKLATGIMSTLQESVPSPHAAH